MWNCAKAKRRLSVAFFREDKGCWFSLSGCGLAAFWIIVAFGCFLRWVGLLDKGLGRNSQVFIVVVEVKGLPEIDVSLLVFAIFSGVVRKLWN